MKTFSEMTNFPKHHFSENIFKIFNFSWNECILNEKKKKLSHGSIVSWLAIIPLIVPTLKFLSTAIRIESYLIIDENHIIDFFYLIKYEWPTQSKKFDNQIHPTRDGPMCLGHTGPCTGPSMPSLFMWYIKALILINKIMSLVSECPINSC